MSCETGSEGEIESRNDKKEEINAKEEARNDREGKNDKEEERNGGKAERQETQSTTTDAEFKQPTAMFKQPALNPVSTDTVESTVKGEEPKEAEPTEPNKSKTPTDNVKSAQPLPYKEPSWGGICSQPYVLEVIKNGVAVNEIRLSTQTYWVVGRLPQCDLSMEHPSLSRYHAVIQYCAVPTDQHPVGWYLFDLGSTHGTILNKKKVTAQTFHRLRVGYTFKFGGSSRLHILQGPDEDQETELTPEDLNALREKRKAQLEEKLRLKAEAENKNLTEGSGNGADGCSWGMDDDAEDIDPDAVNPFSSEVVAEELQLDDPKKTLRGWFEREGYDEPEYIIEEKSHGVHKCTVDLPVDTPTGHPMRAEVSVQGKKKEAVVQCALEACRLLDRQGVLRQAKHESRKRKAKNWGDNDFYDSDDDTFLDRTGDIEKKRKLRMQRAGKLEEEKKQGVVTYDQLVEQLVQVEQEMKEIQDKLDRTKKLEKERAADLDDLDAYMMSIKSGGMNATEKTKHKRRMIELKTDKLRVEKLINIAKPNSLQEVRKKWDQDRSSESQTQQNVVEPSKNQRSETVVSKLTKSERMETDNKTEMSVNPTNNSGTEHEHICRSKSTVQEGRPNESSVSSEPDDVIHSDTKQPAVTDSQSSISDTTQEPVTTSQPNVNEAVTSTQPNIKKAGTSTQPNVKHTKKSPVTTSQPTVKVAKQAPAGGGLAGMVTDLKNKAEEEEYLNDPDHITWMPPKNQSGDGRTRLNDKYGY